MRSLEVLAELFPNKTAKELLEIQKKDKEKDAAVYQKRYKKELKFIEDINTNGGYYKGRFGLDQRYYYRIFNMEMISNEVMMEVDSIVVFLGVKGGVVGENRISIERRTSQYEKLDTYGLGGLTRVTATEWNELLDYIQDISKFWKDVK